MPQKGLLKDVSERVNDFLIFTCGVTLEVLTSYHCGTGKQRGWFG